MDEKKLRRLKGGNKAALTKLIAALTEWIPTASIDALRIKRNSIQGVINKIESYNEELYATYDEEILAGNIEEDIKYREGIEEIIASLDKQINEQSTPSKGKEKSTVKLPALKLLAFEGQFRQWSGFWDLFNCSVHERDDLTNIQKFTYLKGQLVGEPLRLISGLILKGLTTNLLSSYYMRHMVKLIELRLITS